MIAEGRINNEQRPDLNGKPYTFDVDNDFFHLTYKPGRVAFSDYVPRNGVPNEYMIVEFNEDGRVIGFAFEGMLAEWAAKSLKNKFKWLTVRTVSNTQGVALASKVVSEFGKGVLERIPRLDANGRLPSYAP
jgi:hypothetical protein